MRRGWRVVLILLACAAVAGIVTLVWGREREPEYEGKRLSEWLADKEPEEMRAEALRHMGTSAVPFLVRWIRYDSPNWRRKLLHLAVKSRVQLVIKLVGDPRIVDGTDAAAAFRVLGSQASGAIPELRRLMDSEDLHTRYLAARALGGIGKDAVPVLLNVIKGQPGERESAILPHAWEALGTNAAVAVPVLVEWLGGSNRTLADYSADLLGLVPVEPAIAVPALSNAVRSPYPDVKWNAMHSLRSFGPRARGAVPCLVDVALHDSDSDLRSEATSALQDIAPEVLTNGMATGGEH